MLTHSFCCFRGVSVEAERKLWAAGCLEWRQLGFATHVFSARKQKAILGQLAEMQTALSARLAGYFLARLPCGYRLRAWPTFRERTLFVDIETTGLGRDACITVIGVWRDGVLEHFVRGINLEQFLRVAGEAELVVSFNGVRFDWPAIEREFGCTLAVPHIDLLHEARAHGYAGGLKHIEQLVGIVRTEEEEGDGMLAVELWRHYEAHREKAALRRLLAYNACDVTSLVFLARRLLGRTMEAYPGPKISLP